MKNRKRLLELAGIRHRSDLLLEEEGEETEEADDEGGEDLFGDTEGGDEGGDDAEDEEGGEETGGDEEEGGEEAEEEAPPPELKPQEIAKYGPGEIETQVDDIMQQIFDDSLQRGKVRAQTSVGYPGEMTDDTLEIEESLRKRSLSCLLTEAPDEDEAGEEEKDAFVSTDGEEDPSAEQFDIGYFTSEVARYIKNYTTLLDIEGMLFNKAKQFLMSQFGEETSEQFSEKLSLEHGIDFTEKYDAGDSVAHQPTAVGASAAAGAV